MRVSFGLLLVLLTPASLLVAAEPKLSAKVEKVAPPDALADPVRKLH